MRILHVTKKYPNAIGGDAIVVSNLEKQQKRQGHEVFILTSNCDDILNSKNVIKFGNKISTTELDKINIKRIRSLNKLKKESFKILNDIKPDIIHSHSSDLGYAVSFAARHFKIPIINTCHGVTFNDKQYSLLKRKLEIFLLKRAKYNKIITVDPTSLEDFKKNNINNAIYVPNGVDLEEFNIKIKKFKNKIKKILFVGRLEKQKGIDYLIDAINIIKNENIKVEIIGPDLENNYFKDRIKDLKLNNKIKLLGKKAGKELIRYYFHSDIFVLPSLHEGLPLTLLEAMASKLPCISTRVGGIPRIIENNKNGLLVPPKNTSALAEAIIKITDNPKLANEMGENGRKLVEKKYSWKRVSDKIEDIYFGGLNK